LTPLTDQGDVLANRIRAYVAARVPPDQIETVSRTAALVIVTLMRDPNFTNELQIVRELREQNLWLRNQLAITQQTLLRYQPAKKPTSRRAPAKKRTSKSQKRAFDQGVRDLRGR
jgi:hypothetical protein